MTAKDEWLKIAMSTTGSLVADAQGCVQAEDYDGIIAYVLLGTLVVVLKVL